MAATIKHQLREAIATEVFNVANKNEAGIFVKRTRLDSNKEIPLPNPKYAALKRFDFETAINVRGDSLYTILQEARTKNGRVPSDEEMLMFMHESDDMSNVQHPFSLFAFAQELRTEIQKNCTPERAAELIKAVNSNIEPFTKARASWSGKVTTKDSCEQQSSLGV